MANEKKLRVGILFGGRSGEHEVSLASAASVIRALNPDKYEAVPIGIAKDGRWLVGDRANRLLPDVLKSGQRVVLPGDPTAGSLLALGSAGGPAGGGARLGLDVVFPVLHGTFGEDGTIQGLLELADLPYVGAGVLASAVGMDKDVQKRLFRDAGLPIVPFHAFPRTQWEAAREDVLALLRKKFKFPLFVKPANLGSSVGMNRVAKASELGAAIDTAAEYAQKILVERGVKAREIEVSVMGNDEPMASIPGEIVPHRKFYDYTAKYLEQGTRLSIPAKLSKQQVGKFQAMAIRAYRAIECEGMARADFFLEKGTGKIYVNELNTIPGFTAISMYPKLWEASGIPYSDLVDLLIGLALKRQAEKARTKFSIELPKGAAGALEA
jgi:D-alanine-D-alanine ligase